ncbi:MAG: hypothetical protein IRZ01_09795 [Thermoflavifilum aggregans]|nr:hypothetical protein [Thermoflavifilum aggregans]
MNLKRLFTQWHLMRWIRLIAGIWLGIAAWEMHDVWLGLVGALLLLQAVTNTGCGCAGNCSVPQPQKNTLPHSGTPAPAELDKNT